MNNYKIERTLNTRSAPCPSSVIHMSLRSWHHHRPPGELTSHLCLRPQQCLRLPLRSWHLPRPWEWLTTRLRLWLQPSPRCHSDPDTGHDQWWTPGLWSFNQALCIALTICFNQSISSWILINITGKPRLMQAKKTTEMKVREVLEGDDVDVESQNLSKWE